MPAWPHGPATLGLGLGLDLPWGRPIGWQRDPTTGRDRVQDRVVRFLHRYAADASHLFVSWQPALRNRPRLSDHVQAWDDLWERAPRGPIRALHQTALNLAADARYDRAEVVDLTCALAERYDLRWVNEDLGFWSLGGRPLPYPLPPLLTDAGLDTCVRNCVAVREALPVPLVVEFPGFGEGISLTVGPWDAEDHFRQVVQRSDVPCTLDLGHVLSWRWRCGRRGETLLDGLDRLPLAHVWEIHLAGVTATETELRDTHHGVLIDAQLQLLERLVPRCPGLRCVTFEDPRFDRDGRLVPSNADSWARLRSTLGPLKEAA